MSTTTNISFDENLYLKCNPSLIFLPNGNTVISYRTDGVAQYTDTPLPFNNSELCGNKSPSKMLTTGYTVVNLYDEEKKLIISKNICGIDGRLFFCEDKIYVYTYIGLSIPRTRSLKMFNIITILDFQLNIINNGVLDLNNRDKNLLMKAVNSSTITGIDLYSSGIKKVLQWTIPDQISSRIESENLIFNCINDWCIYCCQQLSQNEKTYYYSLYNLLNGDDMVSDIEWNVEWNVERNVEKTDVILSHTLPVSTPVNINIFKQINNNNIGFECDLKLSGSSSITADNFGLVHINNFTYNEAGIDSRDKQNNHQHAFLNLLDSHEKCNESGIGCNKKFGSWYLNFCNLYDPNVIVSKDIFKKDFLLHPTLTRELELFVQLNHLVLNLNSFKKQRDVNNFVVNFVLNLIFPNTHTNAPLYYINSVVNFNSPTNLKLSKPFMFITCSQTGVNFSCGLQTNETEYIIPYSTDDANAFIVNLNKDLLPFYESANDFDIINTVFINGNEIYNMTELINMFCPTYLLTSIPDKSIRDIVNIVFKNVNDEYLMIEVIKLLIEIFDGLSKFGIKFDEEVEKIISYYKEYMIQFL